jgi:hypothetical protein
MNGKGDKPRPVNRERYEENFNEIFGPRIPWWEKQKNPLTNKKDPLSLKHEDERNKKR